MCECAGDLSGAVGVFVAGEEGELGVQRQTQARVETFATSCGTRSAMPWAWDLALAGGRQPHIEPKRRLNNELTCFVWLIQCPVLFLPFNFHCKHEKCLAVL